jgi:cysteinyl-tRNA synthetase
MSLTLYNTLTRTKERFTPIDPKNVRMYVCGPTVYDFAHIGNARPVIVFDVLYRLLKHLHPGPGNASDGSCVEYVRNITDVDDKINARALRDHPDLPLNDAIRKVTETTANQFFDDAKALGCLEPTVQPRATENIDQMVEMINMLLKKDHAYISDGADGREVLFNVSSMRDYGMLSGRSLSEQIAGARVAIDSTKRNPADFVLWKESGVREPGWNGSFLPLPEQGYKAEFKVSDNERKRLGLNSDVVTIHGRPGWHIECSAMSHRYLGEIFDIHGGGLDLIFPHHENEIAQTRCSFDSGVMANVWMHNGFLQVEGQKMSKSLGNFVTISELLTKSTIGPLPGVVLKLAMLTTHYREPIDWTYAKVKEARSRLSGWYRLIHLRWDELSEASKNWQQSATPSKELLEILSDDLNTPSAFTWMYERYPGAVSLDAHTTSQLLGDLRFLGLANEHSLAFGKPIVGTDWPKHLVNTIFDLGHDYMIATANNAVSLSEGIRTRLMAENIRITDDEYDISFDFVGPKLGRTTIDEMITARLEARKNKNWAESDRIRDELSTMGIQIKDNKDGTTSWEVKR